MPERTIEREVLEWIDGKVYQSLNELISAEAHIADFLQRQQSIQKYDVQRQPRFGDCEIKEITEKLQASAAKALEEWKFWTAGLAKMRGEHRTGLVELVYGETQCQK
jgi:hypothetical protein